MLKLKCDRLILKLKTNKMSGIIGKKVGMTSFYDDNGKNIPCTIVEAGPCVITQVKSTDKDGYNALQLGFEDQKESRVNKPKMGHFKKAKVTPKKKLVNLEILMVSLIWVISLLLKFLRKANMLM